MSNDSTMRILVADDDNRMLELLRQGLTEEGHVLVSASNGRDALSLALTGGFELIVLDVMMPGLDGFQVTRALRTRRDRTPILLLTAKDATEDVVTGLDLGADDYLTKPFSFDVLLARVRALARRGPIPHAVSVELGDLRLNQATREVARGTRLLRLTRTEYSMLELLMRNAGRVVTRDSLIASVWGADSDIESNTLDAFVRLLRGKVEVAGEPELIHTVRGVGYCIRVLDA